MNKITCRMNNNYMAQFEKMDGFVIFNFTRKLDGRRYGTYEVSIRKLSRNKRIKKNKSRQIPVYVDERMYHARRT